jgi:hypothetical protein
MLSRGRTSLTVNGGGDYNVVVSAIPGEGSCKLQRFLSTI